MSTKINDFFVKKIYNIKMLNAFKLLTGMPNKITPNKKVIILVGCIVVFSSFAIHLASPKIFSAATESSSPAIDVTADASNFFENILADGLVPNSDVILKEGATSNLASDCNPDYGLVLGSTNFYASESNAGFSSTSSTTTTTNNGVGAPNGTGISVFNTGATYQGLFVFPNTFSRGAKITITAKYNDQRSDGVTLEFGSGGTNAATATYTAPSPTINGFSQNSYVNVDYTVPTSLTGTYNYIRVRGVSGQSYLNIDAINVTPAVCNTCPAGSTPPALSSNTVSNACPSQTYDLTSITASNQPANTTLTWHTATPASTTNRVSNPSTANPGVYYAAFYSSANDCYSVNFNTTPSTVTTTGDYDCDGVLDANDIDDDNDGVLDAFESPLCFYTEDEAKAIILISSTQDLYPASEEDELQALMTSNEAGFNFTNAQTIMGRPIFTLELRDFLELKSIDFNMANTNSFLNSSSILTTTNVILQGSVNGTNWINLSGSVAYDRTAPNNTETFTVTQNSNSYKYYRIIGDPLIITSDTYSNGTVNGITLNLLNQYQASKHPKPTCTQDIDGDGILNHLDLDSDGDGCSDAFESGTTTSETANFSFGASQPDTNGNGFNDNLETQQAGKYDGKYLYYLATSRNFVICEDADGDGVKDYFDIDDDNDGILDAFESPSCFYTESGFVSGDRISNVLVTTSLNMSATYQSPNELVDGDNGTAAANYAVQFVNSQSNANADIYKFEFLSPIELTNIYLQYVNANSHFINGAKVIVRGSSDGINWVELNETSENTYNQANSSGVILDMSSAIRYHSFPITKNRAKYKFYQLYGVSGTIWSSGVSNEVYFELPSDFSPSANPKPTQCSVDTDGDNIANHLDLDSDSDGCSDAFESGTTTDKTANFTFGASQPDTNGNGFNDSLETNMAGQYDSTYTYAIAADQTLDLCFDTDGDGIGDLIDIDDDNDGILDIDEMFPCTNLLDGHVDGSFESASDVAWNENTNTASLNSTLGSTGWAKSGSPDTWTGGFSLNGSGNWGGALNGVPPTPDGNVFAAIYNGFIDETISTNIPASQGIIAGKTYTLSFYQIFGGTVGVSVAGQQAQLRFTIDGEVYLSNMMTYNGNAVKEWEYTSITFIATSNAPNLIIDVLPTSTTTDGNYIGIDGITLNELKPGGCGIDKDTDGDGIFDRLDLDSDNDGCPDVREASVNPTTDLTNATVLNNQGLSYGIKNPANAQLDINGNDTNSDGLNDSIDNDLDGNPNYTSTYNTFALSNNINTCSDTDGDGILDLNDLDDDNDGIFDAIESPSCYFTSTEANNILRITSQFTSPDDDQTDGDIQLLHDASNTQTFNFRAFSTSSNPTGSNIFTIEYPTALMLSTIVISHRISATANSNAIIVGSNDGVTWSSPLSPSTLITTSPITFNITATQNYRYYRVETGTVRGALATNNTIGEITSTLATGYVQSVHPKPDCTSDTDGDGVFNHLDLDSDGDGCTDAFEAGVIDYIDANGLVKSSGDIVNTEEDGGNKTGVADAVAGSGNASDYGSNGFYNGIQSAETQDATYKNTAGYTYGNATNDSIANCVDCSLTENKTHPDCDFDGDGVKNKDDIDDDNDGVLDVDECYDFIEFGPADLGITASSNNFSGSESGIVDVSSSFNLPPNSVIISYSGASYFNNSGTGDYKFAVADGKPITFEFTGSVPVRVRARHGGFIRPGEQDGIESLSEINKFNLTSPIDSELSAGSNATQKFVQSNSSINVSNSGGDFTWESSDVVSQVKFYSTNPPAANGSFNNRINLEIAPICGDTDQDGVINSFDLDSDGDGCTDAKEAGVIDYIDANNYVKSSGDVQNKPADGGNKTGVAEAIAGSGAASDYGTNGFYNELEDVDNQDAVYENTAGYTYTKATDKSDTSSCCEFTDENFTVSTTTPTTCSPANDGAITISGAGLLASTAYNVSYKLNNAATPTTAEITTNSEAKLVIGNLSPGQYSDIVVTSKSDTTCKKTVNGVITVKTFDNQLDANASATDETAVDANDGKLFSTPLNGSGSYTYSWDLLQAIPQSSATPQNGIYTTQNPTNVIPGNYRITVTDTATNCVNTKEVIVNEFNCNTAIKFDTKTEVPAKCFGETTGTGSVSITIDATNAPFNYLLTQKKSDGTVVEIDEVDKSEKNYTNNTLLKGAYTLTVTDVKGCKGEVTINIDGPTSQVVSNASTVSNQTTSGGSEGSVTAEPTGGTPGSAPNQYSYQWIKTKNVDGSNTNNNTVVSTAKTPTGLSPGTYQVTVTDNNGCTATDSTTVSAFNCTLSLNAQNLVLACNGSQGTITATASNTTGDLNYEWQLEGSSSSTTGVIPGAQSNKSFEITGGAGKYSITVSDASNCTSTRTVTITEPSPISISSAVQPVSCVGTNSGTIELTVNGGTKNSSGGYTYSWRKDGSSLSETSQNLVNIPQGFYEVTVTDANNCTAKQLIRVSEPTASLSMDISKLDTTSTGNGATCNSDGSATANVNGGTAPYTYAWTGPNSFSSSSGTISNIMPGTYAVTVTDINGCTVSQQVIIGCTSGCDVAIARGTVNNVNCKGDTSGSASVSASSAMNSGATFVYQWQDGQGNLVPNTNGGNTNSISGVAAGSYTVNVTIQGNSCAAVEETVVISEPANALTAGAQGTGVSSDSASDGTATALPSGGTGPYSYSWNTGATTASITGLSTGIYTVTVTDANGCTAMATHKVVEAKCNNLSATTSSSSVSCSGGSDGSAGVLVTGGSGNYTYIWNNGATSAAITGLSAGTYTVTVTDAADSDCKIEDLSVVVGSPQPLSIGGSISAVKCFGGNTGAVDLTPSGGTGTYTFSWTGTDSFTSTSEDISGLAAGTYDVTMTDANGCTVTASYTVSEPANAVSVTGTVEDVACNGAATGKITLSDVSGGTGTYTYSWSGPSITAATMTAKDQTNLAAGNYSVIVRDSNGCGKTQVFSVSEPTTALAIEIDETDATQSNADSCNNGQATARVSGGTGAYTYQWYEGTTTTGTVLGTTATISDLSGGKTYTVLVTDVKGCTIVQSVNIECTNDCDTAVSIDSDVDVACKGDASGSATVSASSALNSGASFNFVWTNSNGDTISTTNAATSSTISGVPAGSYTVSVTRVGASGCAASKETVVISEPANALTVTTSGSGESFTGSNDGTATATANGGTVAYSYSWSGPSITAATRTAKDQTGLAPGNYTVTVTDANGCSATANFVVSAGDCNNLSASATLSNVSCNGGADGSITVSPQGGTGTYTYQWYAGETASGTQISTDQSVSGLSAGKYSVRVSSTGSSCSVDVLGVQVGQPQALSLGGSVTDVACNGGNTAAIDLTPSGGTGTYTFSWTGTDSFTSTSEDISGLAAGTYDVTMTDANGCTVTAKYTVSEPANAVSVTGTVEDVACNGAATGKITLSDVSGGTGTYTYSWSGPSITATTMAAKDQTNLAAGNYSVIVRDSNDCGKTQVFSVSEPTTALAIEIDETDATQSNADSCNNGQATARVSGGTGAYTYQWYEGSTTTGTVLGTTATISDLSGGKTYTVLVTDVKGCTIVQSVNIECTNDCDTAVSIDSDVDVACKGDASGSATVSASSALNSGASFNFVWTNSNGDTISTTNAATSSTISGVPAGSYTVSVTRVGASGCAASKETVVISEPANALTVTTSGSGESFTGSNDGTATATANGGTVAYSYSWSGPSITAATRTSKDQTGLAPGNYTVTVTDANGCSATANFVVSAGDCNNLSASATLSNVSCNGGADGSITVSPQGGTGTYTYQWYAGETASGTQISTAQSVSGLSAGKYSVRVSSTGSSCSVDVLGVQVGQPQALSLGGSVTDVACNGGNTAAIDLTPSGGTGTYTFSWTGTDSFTSTSEDISGLAAGTYDVTMTDANGCTVTAKYTVSEPANAVSVTGTVEDVACNGAATGKITLSDVSGGTGTYTYSWSGPSITAATMTAKDQTNLAAGNYSVIVTDSNDCGKTQVFSVSEPTTALAIEIDETDATQSNADSCNNGQATARVSGGTGAYTYQWYEGSTTTGTVLGTTATISDLSGGKTYTVLVTDVKGCTIVQSVNIECTNDCDTAVSIDSDVDVACKGDASGSATVSASSALNSGASFNFVWTNSNGDTISTTNAATSSTISGVPAGSYTVSVTRVGASGCAASKETVVISEPANALTVTTSGSGESFTGSNDGTATATANGGTVAYSYSWSGPSITAATRTAKDQTGLAPGNYTVTVTDANGCSATANFVVSAGDCNNLSASATLSNVSCNGGADGSITVSPQGGTGTYTYQWYAGETASGTQISTDQSVSGLSAGKYSVRVSSTGSSCSVDVLGVQVGQPQALSLGGSVTDVACNGGNTAAIDLTPSGGTGTYTFSWTGTDSFTSTSEDISGLAAGTYDVTMTDANGCTVTASYTVSEPANAVSVTGTVEDVACNGAATGKITLSDVSGGTGTYTYSWSGPSITAATMTAKDQTNLAAGNYSVIVRDSNGCGKTQVFSVSEPTTALAIEIDETDATQSNADSCNNGQATARVSGGTGAYTYQWYEGTTTTGTVLGTTATISDLSGGKTYTVLVTDVKGCTIVQSVNIECTNDCDTAVSIDSDVDVACKGDASGSATVSASSALNSGASFNFVWTNSNGDTISTTNAATSSTISGVPAGSYTVSVTRVGASGCAASKETVVISEPANALTVTTSGSGESFTGSNDGTATATANGGTVAYSYSWSGPSITAATRTSKDQTGLAPGNYTVTVTDANGCSATANFVVSAGDCNNLSASATLSNVSCNGGADGSITVSPQGGTGTYTYQWYAGETASGTQISTAQSVSGLSAGKYSVRVSSTGSSCSVDVLGVQVGQPQALSLGGSVTDVACNGGNTAAIDLTPSGGTGTYTFSWTGTDSFTSTSEDISGLAAGTYDVTMTDANGCTVTAKYTVSEPANAVSVTGTVEDVACNGAATGKITLSDVSGGTGTYTYSWSGPSITAATMTAKDQTNLAAGNYSVIVTDSNDCGKTQVFSVSEPTTALAIEIDETDATQSNADSCNNGQATARVSGGTGAYTYQWYEGSTTTGTVLGTTATISDLSGGKTYTVLVTDVKGCTIVQSVNIECTNDCDTAVSIDSDVDVACKGDASGSATVSASSALNSGASFNFVWTNSNGDTISTTNAATSSTISGVPAGSYTVSVTRVGASGCAASKETVVISEPANALTVTTSGSGESFTGSNDGTATATANGGTVAYSYSWSGPSITAATRTSKDQTGLAPGNYTVTVTDANGCSATANFVVSAGDCNNLSASATLSNVSCNGGADGSITVSPQGGTGTYTYQWYAGETASGTQISTDQSVSGLSAGKYSVRVSSTGSSCSVDVLGVQVGQPQPLNLGGSSTNSICGGTTSGGAVDLTPSGGTGAYMFSWTGPESFASTSEDISALKPGTYTVTMTDVNGCTVTASFEIKDNCTNAVQDITNTFKNTPVSGNVLTNDTDPEGDTLRATPQTDLATASGGVVTINADGSYTYTPATDYVGEDSFSYTMCDDGTPQACDSATVFIEVLDPANPANEPPVANGDVATAKKDTALDINVLINDFDPDRDPITITEVGQPSNGKATINDGNTPDDPSDDTIIYTPNPGFTGTDTFTYQICDNATPKGCDTATVEVTVEDTTGKNTTTANDDAYTTYPGDVLRANVLDNDNDLEDDIQSASLGRGPSHGNLELQPDGSFEYTPDAGYQGPDSFTYTVCDDGMPQACDTATVVITVGGIKNSTNAKNDINNTYINQSVSGNVLTNDSDLEGDVQTISVTGVFSTPNGSVTLNADGSYVYTPKADFIGADSFTYQVCDDGTPVACDTATVYIEVIKALITPDTNTPPVANADTAETTLDVPVSGNLLANDFDQDGDKITVTQSSITTSNGGTVTIDPITGNYTYTPAKGFKGTDTFTYEICDDASPKGCDTAVVTITVLDLPSTINTTTANDDAYNSNSGLAITGNVLDNDFDAQGDTQTVTLIGEPLNGRVVLLPNGEFTYTPNDAMFSGVDKFEYEVCDNGIPKACDRATVIITYDGGQPRLVFTKLSNVTNDGSVGDTIEYSFSVENVGNSTAFNVLIDDDRIGVKGLVVTPKDILPGQRATASATYTITAEDVSVGRVENSAIAKGTDQRGNPVQDVSDNGNETKDSDGDGDPGNDPTITFTNDKPIAVNDDRRIDVNDALSTISTPIDILGNDDFRADGPVGGSLTIISNPRLGTLDINDNGTPDDPSDDIITYTPIRDLEVNDVDTFEYQICDSNGDCSIATVTITIIGVGPVDRCKNPDISNVLTPNDDGKNDWFKIDNIDCYPSNTMQIFNRWGVRVFEATNYGFNNNVFRGYSNGRVTIKDSERLPVGTYFYIFKYVDPEGIPQQASSYVYLQY